MNKKIFFSSISIISALALMAGSTFAVFTSAASITVNTFGAGTLVLTINNSAGSTSTPVFNVTGATPRDVTNTQVLNLRNTGTVNSFTTTLTGIAVTPTVTVPATPNLGDKLDLELWNDVNDNNVIDPGTDTQIGLTAPLTAAQWTNLSLGFGINAGSHHKVLARITFNNTADDTYQGSSASFNLSFQASQ